MRVNGKSIGAYSNPLSSSVKRVREHANLYVPPKLFALLTSETAKLRLGPDFELGELIAFKDFVGADGHKVYTTERHTDVLPLRQDLIEKLIKLRERLRQKGVAVTRFAVTSGFRTPDYNRQIKGAQFSRHCYGDAVDIYIDENNDHHMDDLNGDGKLDRKDGLIIANACRELELEGAVVPGGIGVYRVVMAMNRCAATSISIAADTFRVGGKSKAALPSARLNGGQRKNFRTKRTASERTRPVRLISKAARVLSVCLLSRFWSLPKCSSELPSC